MVHLFRGPNKKKTNRKANKKVSNKTQPQSTKSTTSSKQHEVCEVVDIDDEDGDNQQTPPSTLIRKISDAVHSTGNFFASWVSPSRKNSSYSSSMVTQSMNVQVQCACFGLKLIGTNDLILNLEETNNDHLFKVFKYTFI